MIEVFPVILTCFFSDCKKLVSEYDLEIHNLKNGLTHDIHHTTQNIKQFYYMSFLGTVKAAPQECVIRSGQP